MPTMPSVLLLLPAAAMAALLCGPLEVIAHTPSVGSAGECPSAAAITRSAAHQLCGGSPVADSLRSVGLYRRDGIKTSQSISKHLKTPQNTSEHLRTPQ
eukprot:SAG31_NODE_31082_length_372_cov_1.084249_1_plen_98_part_10